jgi:DNA-binding XRE family transcriptional regulator
VQTVGNKIAYFREKKNINQDELAKAVNITRPYLSNIENDKQKPSYVIAKKISIALGEPLDAIFFDESVHHNEHSTA